MSKWINVSYFIRNNKNKFYDECTEIMSDDYILDSISWWLKEVGNYFMVLLTHLSLMALDTQKTFWGCCHELSNRTPLGLRSLQSFLYVTFSSLIASVFGNFVFTNFWLIFYKIIISTLITHLFHHFSLLFLEEKNHNQRLQIMGSCIQWRILWEIVTCQGENKIKFIISSFLIKWWDVVWGGMALDVPAIGAPRSSITSKLWRHFDVFHGVLKIIPPGRSHYYARLQPHAHKRYNCDYLLQEYYIYSPRLITDIC